MRARGYLIDGAVALALAAASLVLGFGFFFATSPYQEKLLHEFGSAAGWQRAVLVWWLFGALCVAGLVLQRRWPLPALVLCAVGATAHLLDQSFKTLPIDLSVVIVLYTFAATARRWVAWTAVTVLAVGAYTVAVVRQIAADSGAAAMKGLSTVEPLGSVLYTIATQMFSTELLLVLAFALGTAARTRRAHLRTLEQRAADLERERDQRAALATAAERARITRELHDVVAHGLSVMVVQAQGAAAALARHPERAAAALEHVIGTGRTSLAEMRRLLGIVRRDAGLVPQPGVGELPALVDRVRAAGTPVELRVDGQPEPLPPGVDLSAYRIVQEALTNVLKHAGSGARATVRLDFRPDRLEIEVTDDGCAAPSSVDGGSGLRGIAERVGLFGGTLTAGPDPAGGFTVRATLPWESEAAASGRSAAESAVKRPEDHGELVAS